MAAAYAVGRGSARGSVLVKLFAQAEAQAAGDLALQLDGKSVIQVKAKVRADAFAKASSEAHALAECRDNPPEHDECPNIPGNQPPGYECNPPEVNKPPTCELVQHPEHMYVSLEGKEPSRYRAKAVWSDPDEQLTKDDATVTVTGQAFIVKGNDMFPERWDTEGNQVVYTFWIETKQQTGNATLSMEVFDSKGAKCEDSKTFPVVEDEF